jgi:hypothetical protein
MDSQTSTHSPAADGEEILHIRSLADVQRALTNAGYVTQHEAGKDDSVLFKLGGDAVVVTVGANFLRVSALKGRVEELAEDKLADLFAEMLSSQFAVAPYAFAVVPDDEGGEIVLVATMVLEKLDDSEFIETVHRLPSAMVIAAEILAGR